MPRFKVEIRGEGLERALTELNAAGIPTLGPTFAGWSGSEEPMTVGDSMLAVLDADTAETAAARVKEALPADGAYTIARAEPFEPAT